MYVLHSSITSYVPNGVVKIVLTLPDTDGERCRWITQILEFDLTNKTKKLVKGQGLAKLLAKSNCKVPRINSILEVKGKNPQEPYVLPQGKNPYEPSILAQGKNPQEPFLILEGKNPQEPSLQPKENNPQEALPSDQINSLHIDDKFLLSNWYQVTINFLLHFECLASFSKSQCKTLKFTAVKYYIINANLYWKDPLNIILLCFTKSETGGIIY